MDGEGGHGGDGDDGNGFGGRGGGQGGGGWGGDNGGGGMVHGCHGGMTDTHSAMGQTHASMSSTSGFGLHGGHGGVPGQVAVHGLGTKSTSGSEGQCTSQDGSESHKIRDGMEVRFDSCCEIDLWPFIRGESDQLNLSCVDFRASYLHGAVLFYEGRVEVPGTLGAPSMVPKGGCTDQGTTYVWRQYWQIGYRRDPVGFMESFGFSQVPLMPRRQIRGFIEVTRVSWKNEDGKFEECLRVVVKHVPVKILKTGQLVCDGEDEAAHWKVAKQLFERCTNYMRSRCGT